MASTITNTPVFPLPVLQQRAISVMTTITSTSVAVPASTIATDDVVSASSVSCAITIIPVLLGPVLQPHTVSTTSVDAHLPVTLLSMDYSDSIAQPIVAHVAADNLKDVVPSPTVLVAPIVVSPSSAPLIFRAGHYLQPSQHIFRLCFWNFLWSFQRIQAAVLHLSAPTR